MYLAVCVFLVIIGTVFLIASLFPIRFLVHNLPSKDLRNLWRLLGFLVGSFILSYLIYAVEMWLTFDKENYSHLVPTIFCFGGLFVFLVAKLSQKTAMDLNEMDTLKKENITDSLMKIYNRRYFEKAMERELFKSNHTETPLSLLLLDIDHFKRINDSYGHQKGDEVLLTVAHLVSITARQSDIVARYGGEEICVIAPFTTQDNAIILAERIRDKIEQSILGNCMATQEEIKGTISIGVATNAMYEKASFIDKADQALYYSKKSGRNQVTHYNDLDSLS